MSEAKRYNAGKPKLSYFARSFHKALEAIARVKEFGATKYEEDNWKMGNKPDSEYLDSMARHLDAFQQGETYDRESGCHHLGHAIWNLCALFELNHAKDDVVNEPLFQSQMKYWAGQKEIPKTLKPAESVVMREVEKKFHQFLGKEGKNKDSGSEKCPRRNCQPNSFDTPTTSGAHPYVDNDGNPLSLKRAFEMKASGHDVFGRVYTLKPTYRYTTGIGTPIPVDEAVRRSAQGLSIKIILNESQQKFDFSSVHPQT